MNLPHARSRGFSLVELMVALAIGLIIVAAMLQNLAASSGSNRTNARVSEFQSNGRFAADFLRRELQHTGFAGVSWTNLTELGATGTTNYGCGVGFAANIAQPIWGANDSNPFSGTCIPAANYARRRHPRAAPRRPRLPSRRRRRWRRTSLYFRSEYLQGSVFVGPTRPANLQTPVADYLLHTDVYYISKWTNSASESPQVPALYRMTLGPGPAMTAQLVASDIENMQVQYGVSTGRRHPLLRRVGRSRVALDERGRRAPVAAGAQHRRRARVRQHRGLHDGRPDLSRPLGDPERRLPAPGLPAGRADAQMTERGSMPR